MNHSSILECEISHWMLLNSCAYVGGMPGSRRILRGIGAEVRAHSPEILYSGLIFNLIESHPQILQELYSKRQVGLELCLRSSSELHSHGPTL